MKIRFKALYHLVEIRFLIKLDFLKFESLFSQIFLRVEIKWIHSLLNFKNKGLVILFKIKDQ